MGLKYKDGDRIGPNEILMIKRTTKYKSGWKALFQCPYCGKEFETWISHVSNGQTRSCGCLRKIITTAKDITNQKFGRLTALYRTDKRTSSGISYWHCKCECGNECDVRITSLLNGETQSCGCLRRDLRTNNLTNQKFGHLTAIKRLNEHDSANYWYWLCQCDCGNTIKVGSHSLVSGNTQTCGQCNRISLQEEKIAKILKELNINFISQFTFENCINPKTNRKLKFDFYLLDYNIIIEYDGEQHFIQNDYFKDNLSDIQERDNIKNKYCQQNNIKLIRIPYYDKEKINKKYILTLIKGE